MASVGAELLLQRECSRFHASRPYKMFPNNQEWKQNENQKDKAVLFINRGVNLSSRLGSRESPVPKRELSDYSNAFCGG
jgi:hypothetical protein